MNTDKEQPTDSFGRVRVMSQEEANKLSKNLFNSEDTFIGTVDELADNITKEFVRNYESSEHSDGKPFKEVVMLNRIIKKHLPQQALVDEIWKLHEEIAGLNIVISQQKEEKLKLHKEIAMYQKAIDTQLVYIKALKRELVNKK